jgi:peptidyl-prolyl cis-trans isomerase SurA
MKSKLFVGVALTGTLAFSLAMRAKDPVVMTVNGEDVPLSEFEYLYHKNAQQQVALQPLDEYAEIFEIYKLKVADAKAMGIDTTAQFQKELAQYRRELAAPFMTDSAYLRTLTHEAYDRMQQEVEAYHIMRFKTPYPEDNARSIQLLDSIRTLIDNGEDFATLAAKYSQDRGSMNNGGRVGYLAPLRFPYNFETAAYNLAPGEISEVIESPVAYHIVKGGNHRASRGKITASHILKLVPQGATPEAEEIAKQQIDSIYNVVLKDPSEFEKMAVYYSDDKNSGRNGGLLPQFGVGEMIESFDSVAFALADGEISAPVRTRYGWHIIKRFSVSPIDSYEKMEERLISVVSNPNDKRSELIADNQLQSLQKEYKCKANDKLLKEMKSYVQSNGIDSLFYVKYFTAPASNNTLYKFGNQSVTLADIAPQFEKYNNSVPELALADFEKRTNNVLRNKLVEYKEYNLENEVADYRNLLHEFRDGSLLYEAGKIKVWDKAPSDKEGLEQYFEQHRDEYTWNQPRAKGYLIQVTNDSIEQAVRNRLKELSSEDMIPTIRKEFAGNVQIDKVLYPQGSNQMVDYLMFGGPEVKPSNSRFTNFFMYDCKVIDKPEDINDVKGLVTSDYQNVLEDEWVRDIKARYPVKVYPNVLKKAK